MKREVTIMSDIQILSSTSETSKRTPLVLVIVVDIFHPFLEQEMAGSHLVISQEQLPCHTLQWIFAPYYLVPNYIVMLSRKKVQKLQEEVLYECSNRY